MKRCQIDCEIISNFDLFGKEPEFFYKGKHQRVSWFGRIFSVLYIALYVAYLIYKVVRMIEKVDIDFYETYAFSGIPTIKLNNELFYGGFTIGGIIDETLYFPMVYHYTETTVNGVKQVVNQTVPLVKCSLDRFGKRFQPLFADRQLDNLYCMEKVEDELTGYSNLDVYSYYYIAIIPCIGYNPKYEQCQDISKVTEFFQQTFLEFKIQDVVMTPKDYDNPSEPRTMDIKGPVFSTLYQSIYTYLQIVNLETDRDWVGFEALSDIKKEQFLRYDESWIIAAPSPHSFGLQPFTPVCDITIQLSAKVLTTKRTNTKIINALGDVGGLMEVVSSLFTILAGFITDLLYDIDIVNTLFSFDLKRKVVQFKRDKNELYELNNDDEINIYNRQKTSELSNSRNKIDNKFIDSKSNKDTLSKSNVEEAKLKKKKKKKIKFQKGNNINNIIEPQNLKININQNQQMKIVNKQNIMNNNSIVSSENLRPEISNKEDKTNSILDEIKINKFFIVFAFCCIRKRKNVNNYVLNEGLNIIGQRLDIINIFKKLYYDEKVQKYYVKLTEELPMSDECKEKIA
jgi:hypothetical protein